MKNTLQFNPAVIGHRGACAYAPENTIASFTKAMQLGVKWVEFDVMQALDGELFIFHDDVLDRTSTGHGDPTRLPYSLLSALDAGAWFDARFSGERIPTLRSVLEFLTNANINANVEIKVVPGNEERMVKALLKQMRPYLLQANAQYLFSSFSVTALQLLRHYSHGSQIGLLLHHWEPEWQTVCAELDCVSVHVFEEIMTAQQAKSIKDMHKTLLCYTVNQPARATELFSWGVDAVFSDAPDLIQHLS